MHIQPNLTLAVQLYHLLSPPQGYTILCGDDHPRTLNTINNMAILHTEQGAFSEAKELFDRSLAVKERTLGFAHPATLDTANNLASVLMELGDLLGAQILFEKVLAAYTELQVRPYLAPIGSFGPYIGPYLAPIGSFGPYIGPYLALIWLIRSLYRPLSSPYWPIRSLYRPLSSPYLAHSIPI